MGKYRSNSRNQAGPPRNQIPPLVRGIGCITMVIIPLLSYGIAVYWIQNGLPGSALIPPSLLGAPNIPSFFFSSPAFSGIANFLAKQNNLSANLIFALAIAMIIGGFMAIVYGYIYSMFGPSKYGPTDVPPPRVKTKKYTR
jgi:ABC-type antimicrobial peptide transport system permease subunit